MKRAQRKNILFRLLAAFILLLVVAFSILSIIYVFKNQPEGLSLKVVALIATIAFCGFEIFVILLGWKRESNLQKIVFDEREKINSVGLVIIIAGTLFGAGLTILPIILFFQKNDINVRSNAIIILAIGAFLLLNCLIYYLYLLMFRPKPFKLEDLIK